jgi:multidrug efflux pump subunit AcrA (membrane-fusion protein)
MTARLTDRAQIEALVDQLADAVHESRQPAQTLQQLLASLSPLTGAMGARLWLWGGGTSAASQELEAGACASPASESASRHDAVAIVVQGGADLARFIEPSVDELRQVASLEVPATPVRIESIVGSGGASGGPSGSDGSSALRWLLPVRKSNRTLAVLEFIKPRADIDPLPLASVVVELLAELLLDQEVRQLREAAEFRRREREFFQRLGAADRVDVTAQIIAQEGRGLLGCDRVAVVQWVGRTARTLAVSGSATFDRRSPEIHRIERLVEEVVRRDGRFNSPPAPSPGHEFSPSEESSSAENGSHQVHLVRENATRIPSAAIVLELISHEGNTPEASRSTRGSAATWHEITTRWEGMEPVVAAALRQALLVETIPLAGFWRGVSRQWHTTSLRRWMTRALLISLLAGLVIALAVFPGELQMTGQGAVWPRERRHVFAPDHGRVDQVHVRQGSAVKAGDILLTLSNPQLELEATRLQGEILTLEKQIDATRSARVQLTAGSGEQAAKAAELSAQELGLEQQLSSAREELTLVKVSQGALEVRSPVDGEVTTWDPQQNLAGRPVERGQLLLEVGDSQGPWVVDVRVTDQSVGHILGAMKNSQSLPAEFVLATRPEETHAARVESVSEVAELDEVGQSYVRVVLAFDREKVLGLRPGATAIPRIHCGRAPIGYVWLHDLIDRLRLWWAF